LSAMRIQRAGLLTTVQDLGRRGYQALGVPPCGAMDSWSARLANRLAGNPDRFAVLEITIVGPRFAIDREAWIAVAGADFEVRIGAVTRRVPFVSHVMPGTDVAFGERRCGARAYLAVDGGIATPPVLGSASTHLLARMGGVDGRALKAGDRVPLGAPGTVKPPPLLSLDLAALTPRSETTLHVVPGAASDGSSARPWSERGGRSRRP